MKEDNVCEPKVYESLFHEHSESLRNFMYYKCGNLDQAEDLAQDAFIKLWQNCAKVIKEKAKSYIFTIANNSFLNEVKHKKVVMNFEKSSTFSTVEKETPEFIIEENEFKDKLENAISNLTEAQREVFLLNRIEGKKYREIAEMLDISQKAVEKRMSKALITLRKSIKNI